LASVAGLAISLIGFAATLWNVARSRSAAERAEKAARNARARFRLFDSIAALAEALNRMQDIKRLHREGAWEQALFRYEAVRSLLTNVRTSISDLSTADERAMQRAVADLTSFEEEVENAIRRETAPDGPEKFNPKLSRHIERVEGILASMKQRMEN
jgi:hypothetical protein